MEFEEATCPLCVEVLDPTEQGFFPCPCRYQVCLWCVHHIREQLNGTCPACRKEYLDEDFVTDEAIKQEAIQRAKEKQKVAKEAAALKAEQQMADLHAAAMAEKSQSRAEWEKQKKRREELSKLATVRIVQRNVIYVMGIAPSIAKADILKSPEFFGQYGNLLKVSVNQQAFIGRGSSANVAACAGTYAAYLTFATDEEAKSAKESVDGFEVDGHALRVTFGTTRYCQSFIKDITCNKADCAFLHALVEKPIAPKRRGGQRNRERAERAEKQRERQNCEQDRSCPSNERNQRVRNNRDQTRSANQHPNRSGNQEAYRSGYKDAEQYRSANQPPNRSGNQEAHRSGYKDAEQYRSANQPPNRSGNQEAHRSGKDPVYRSDNSREVTGYSAPVAMSGQSTVDTNPMAIPASRQSENERMDSAENGRLKTARQPFPADTEPLAGASAATSSQARDPRRLSAELGDLVPPPIPPPVIPRSPRSSRFTPKDGPPPPNFAPPPIPKVSRAMTAVENSYPSQEPSATVSRDTPPDRRQVDWQPSTKLASLDVSGEEFYSTAIDNHAHRPDEPGKKEYGKPNVVEAEFGKPNVNAWEWDNGWNGRSQPESSERRRRGKKPIMEWKPVTSSNSPSPTSEWCHYQENGWQWNDPWASGATSSAPYSNGCVDWEMWAPPEWKERAAYNDGSHQGIDLLQSIFPNTKVMLATQKWGTEWRPSSDPCVPSSSSVAPSPNDNTELQRLHRISSSVAPSPKTLRDRSAAGSF